LTAAFISDVDRFRRRLRPAQSGQPVWVAGSPAAVDCMGGLGEWSGSMLLTATLRTAACAAAQLRDDHQFEVHLHRGGQPLDPAVSPLRLSMAAVLAHVAEPTNGRDLWSQSPASLHEFLRPIFAVLGALASEPARRIAGGVTLEIDLTDAYSPLTGGSASVASATLAALSAATHRIDEDRANLTRYLERIAAAPDVDFGGMRLLLTGMIGPKQGLLQWRRQPQHHTSQVELPAGVMLAAIETYPLRPIRRERVAESHIAAAMGLRIIQDLMRHDGANAESSGANLINITPQEYVERFRNRLPAKITGQAFMDRYGASPDVQRLDPVAIYKPRSRAEHHIYENQRVHEFESHLRSARRNADEKSLPVAGELMFASHWSHSQRCGLGSVETDAVSQWVRQRGPAQGFYGAKLASGWSGGLMVVLMADTPSAHAGLAEISKQAEQRFRTPFRVHMGSDAGAALTGAQPLDGTAGAAGR